MNIYRFVSNLIHTTFDGVNERIDLGDIASFQFERTNTFSFSAWINPDTTTTGYILGKYETSRGYIVGFEGSNYLYFQVMNSGSNRVRVRTSTTFSTSTLYHVIITYDGSSSASGVKIYINGTSDTLTTLQDNLTGTVLKSVGFSIGDLGDGATSVPFNGKIDKVIVYNDVVTGGEVTTIYNYGREIGLIGIGNEVSQWELDTLNPSDEIGSNDGTSVNMDSSNIGRG